MTAFHRLTPAVFSRPPQPAAPAPAPPAAPAPSASPYPRYSLSMDPEVVAALAYEKQGLSDLASSPMPSMPSTAQYDIQLRHLQELRPIQLDQLSHDNTIQQRAIINNLAARGMLRSGENSYLQGERQRSYGLATQSVDRNIRWQQEAISAARSAANSAYQQAVAARQQGIAVSQRQLHNSVIQAYVNAYQRVIENPALYLGADPNFDPRSFLGQIPTQ